jgi:hypothetical protein
LLLGPGCGLVSTGLVLQLQEIQIAADLLTLCTKPQPQTLQRGAGEGPHLKTLTKPHEGRQLQSKQPMGDAVAEA